MSLLPFEKRTEIADKALREFFEKAVSEGFAKKSWINDMILSHTEGGEADAIALKISEEQIKCILTELNDLGEVENGFGDKESGDMTVINIPTKAFNKIFCIDN